MKLQAVKIKLTLHTLSKPVPSATPGDKITDISSYSDTFSLNQIPTATVSIPVGAPLEGDNLVQATGFSAYSSKLQERTPMAVVLEVTSKEGMDGLAPGKYCLFKGYLSNINSSFSAKQGTFQIVLHHWLSDLTLTSTLNPLSSPENPANISQQAAFQTTPTENVDDTGMEGQTTWVPMQTAANMVRSSKNMWNAIRIALLQIVQKNMKGLKPGMAGYTSLPIYNATIAAINRIRGQNLELSSVFDTKGNPILSQAIGNTLQAQTSNSYYSATIWDKLISTLLPAFNMCLVPLVERAYVIPMPGVCMPSDPPTKVTVDETIQLNVNLAKTGMLAGIALVCSSTVPIESSGTPQANVSTCRYPEDDKPGVYKVCQLPKWLEASLTSDFINYKVASYNSFVKKTAPGDGEQENNEHQEDVQENYSTYDKLCKAFVHTTYNAEVTKNNGALLIANLDFERVPGSVIKIEMPSPVGSVSGNEDYILGSVVSVGRTITSNSVQATYRLANIRDKTLNKQLGDSPGDIIFESGWDNKGASLAEKIG